MSLSGFCVFILASWIVPTLCAAQNLVPNGSFEDYHTCPGSYSQSPSEFRVTSWRSVNSGSPDYFNSCSEGEAGVPYNWAGLSDAFDGHGYAGIYMWMDLEKDYREYLHCKLIEPLIKDSVYYIEFRYKLSSYSKYCTDRIGLLLSDSLKTISNDRPLKIAPTIVFQKDSALTPETGAWELAAAEFRATGKEQFLTIGNFSDNKTTSHYYIQFRPASEPMLASSAYYYIDGVKVIPKFAPRDPEVPPVFAGDVPAFNTTYVLENIQFEFNSYALIPVSYIDLDRVLDFLIAHPQVSVTLTGHTDDVGNVEYNDALSKNRAKSAAAYLISKGISEDRISTFGYGEQRPLISEQTEEARQVNRRVEISFHE